MIHNNYQFHHPSNPQQPIHSLRKTQRTSHFPISRATASQLASFGHPPVPDSFPTLPTERRGTSKELQGF